MRHRAPHLLRRIGGSVAAALLLPSAPVVVSYVSALTARVTSAVRSVEWLRDHHGGFVVAFVENVYYTFNQPPTGGSLHAFPGAGEAKPYKLLPGMPNRMYRYLVPDRGDFFVVLARAAGNAPGR